MVSKDLFLRVHHITSYWRVFGDTRLLKPFTVGLVAWEMLWVTGILEH